MKGVVIMIKQFSIMMPCRVAKSNEEYADDIRALVKHMRNTGIKVLDLKETDILDQNNIPVERVYMLECFGETNVISGIFSNTTTGHYGETVFYA